MHSRLSRRAVIAGAILAALAGACTGSDANKSRNPGDRPAVVTAAPPSLPMDTAKPDTSGITADRVIAARQEMYSGYALLALAARGQDGKMLRQVFAPDIVLKTPDSTFTGLLDVGVETVDWVHRNRITEFARRSVYTAILKDSMVLDSGTYTITGGRGKVDAIVVEKGRYGATWRIHPLPMTWALKSDRLYPTGPVAARDRHPARDKP